MFATKYEGFPSFYIFICFFVTNVAMDDFLQFTAQINSAMQQIVNLQF